MSWITTTTLKFRDPLPNQNPSIFETVSRLAKSEKMFPRLPNNETNSTPKSIKFDFYGMLFFAILSLRKPWIRPKNKTWNKPETKMKIHVSVPNKFPNRKNHFKIAANSVLDHLLSMLLLPRCRGAKIVPRSAPEVPKWSPMVPKWKHERPEITTARS